MLSSYESTCCCPSCIEFVGVNFLCYLYAVVIWHLALGRKYLFEMSTALFPWILLGFHCWSSPYLNPCFPVWQIPFNLHWTKDLLAHKSCVLREASSKNYELVSSNAWPASHRHTTEPGSRHHVNETGRKAEKICPRDIWFQTDGTDKRCVVLARPSVNHIHSAAPPVGCQWSDNSCAHDATSFVLFNLWTADWWPWDEIIGMDNNMWMRNLVH